MIGTAIRVLVRAQATRGRVVFAGVVGVLVVVAALAARLTDAGQAVPTQLVLNAGFGFLAPVVSLTFAAASLGDLVEDRTLVYLWLRPVPRLWLAGAAIAASLLVAGPLVAVPLALAEVAGGRLADAVPAAVASLAAVVAYTTLFVPLGLRTKRSLLWGLLYALLWEGTIANVNRSFATVSLQRYARSLFVGLAPDVGARSLDVSMVVAVCVIVGVAVLGTLGCARLLKTQDVP